MMEIPLTQGMVTLVDDQDYATLSSFSWCAANNNHGRFYAATKTKQRSYLYMHRVIMGASRGQHIHHLNGDSLNNTRANLSIVSNRDHARMHTQGRKDGTATSRFVGVCRRTGEGWWSATIVRKRLGNFKSEIDAAAAYNRAALTLFGPGARLNQVNY